MKKAGGFGLLQIVLELDTRWIVRSHIDWRAEWNISYKSVETAP